MTGGFKAQSVQKEPSQSQSSHLRMLKKKEDGSQSSHAVFCAEHIRSSSMTTHAYGPV